MLHEIARQRVEQFGIARRVGWPEIVDRINDPATEQMKPNSISLRPGELRVARDPVSHRIQRITTRIEELSTEKTWFGLAAGPWVLDVAPRCHVNDLLAFELVLVIVVLPPIFDDLVLHLRKNPRP